MKKKILVTLVFTGLFSFLVACNNNANRTNDYARNTYNRDLAYDNYAYNYANDYAYDDNVYNRRSFDYYENDNTAYNRRSLFDDRTDGNDRHYDFVSRLGFKNVVNPNGYTYHERYRLNGTNATNPDIFHGWRHTWVEPNNYIDKEIDVYRYTGDYNGESRTIHIKSYNGEVLGGYHFGSGEAVEHARMINYDGHSSRLSNDFRNVWDDLFDT